MRVSSKMFMLAVLLVLAPAGGASAQTASSAVEVARAFRETHEARIVRDFAELLALPNNAADSVGIRRTASFIRARLEAAGATAELLELPGAPPVVYGEMLVPGATRTLGLYVHYDGQPADTSRWTNPPFQPTLYGGALKAGATDLPLPRDGDAVDPEWRIYARSAGDDKAPIAALIPVLEAFREGGVRPTSNLVFLFEGEEEAGSDNLGRYIERYRDRLDPVDVWLFLDGPVHQSGRPQLVFGVRGVTGMQVTVYGPNHGLHSGHYGNWAPVPGQLLAHLLASMKAEDGRVLIDGFYDTVDPLSEADRAALEALPRYDEELKRELGLAWTEGEPESLAQRLLLPALTIQGITTGNTGPLTRNVIPATATAALGIRMVKGNDPTHMLDLVEDHIRGQGYHIVHDDPDLETRLAHRKIAKVTRSGGYPASRTSLDDPFAQQVIAAVRAVTDDVFDPGSLVLVPGLGGSLPLYLFTDVLEKPAVTVPVANHDDNQHAPDENLRIGNLWYAIDLYAALLSMPH